MKPFRFSLIADIHVDLFQNLSLLREDMLTDRAEEIDLVWKEAIDRTLEAGITQMFILGDTFHRRNIRSDAINGLVKRRLNYAKEKGLNLDVLIGNHDQAAISGKVHAFEPFKDVCNVIDKPIIKTISGFDFLMLPYEEYRGSVKSLEILLKKSKNPNRILLGHLGIVDTLLSGFDHLSKEPISTKELQLDKFIYGYFGHYHLPQQVAKNAMYVGSPCQHSLNDKSVNRGYIEVEISLVDGNYKATNELKVIDSPKFLELEANDYKANDYKGKHYIKATNATKKQLKELQNDLNIMSTTGKEIITVVDEDKVINGSLSWEEMIKKYIKITEPNRRKHRRLFKIGKEFLE